MNFKQVVIGEHSLGIQNGICGIMLYSLARIEPEL